MVCLAPVQKLHSVGHYTLHLYEGAEHAFNNDTSTARYKPEAATLAWTRTVDFFRQHLKA